MSTKEKILDAAFLQGIHEIGETISGFPLPLFPPKMDEVNELLR